MRARVMRALLDGMQRLGDKGNVSSSHALFLTEEDLVEFAGRGFAVRHSLQFHWNNRGYDTFSDYLEALEGKRRRQVARERRQLGDEGLEIERLTGEALGPEHANIMYRFYLATFDRKWGFPLPDRRILQRGLPDDGRPRPARPRARRADAPARSGRAQLL
jgi:predicted N-acyltransferase